MNWECGRRGGSGAVGLSRNDRDGGVHTHALVGAPPRVHRPDSKAMPAQGITPLMHLHQATSADVEIVCSVLRGVTAALQARGIDLWSVAETSETAVAPHVAQGLYQLAFQHDELVGVFRLQPEDPLFWSDVAPAPARYLHKLAVLPAWQGQGCAHAMLELACAVARQQGADRLRLDCRSGRPRLRAVYETFGFALHSQIQINGAMFDRFELRLADGRPLSVAVCPS